MTPIVLGPSRGRLFVMLLSSLAFVVAGVFIVFVGDLSHAVVGFLPIIFFGACAAVFALQMIDARPRIVLNDEGVFDRTLRIGIIPWTQIVGAEVHEVAQSRFVSLRLRDEHAFTSRLGAVHRRLADTNTMLGFQPLNLNFSVIDADPFAIAELIIKEAVRRHVENGTYRTGRG